MINVTLCNIADIRPGYPFRGSIISTPSATTYAVQVRDINKFGEIETEHLITTQLKGRKQPDYLHEGDILFVAKGTKHFATYVQKVPEQSVCSPSVHDKKIKKLI